MDFQRRFVDIVRDHLGGCAATTGGPGGTRLRERVRTKVRQSLLNTSGRVRKARKGALLSPQAALAERIERAHALDPVVGGLSDSVVRGCRPARGPTPCTACRSASLASGRGPAAPRLLDLGGAPRPVPRHRPRLGHAHRGRRRRDRARRGHRAGRLVGAAPGSAAGRAGARDPPGRGRPRCSWSRWRPGPAAGPDTARCCPASGLAVATGGSSWAATWRCGLAPAAATPIPSATWPGWAGTTCAR